MEQSESHVYLDAKPSEQIQLDDATTLCFGGLNCYDSEAIPKLKQYKATRSAHKVAAARRLIEAIESKRLRFNACAIVGEATGNYLAWAEETLDSLTPIATIEKTGPYDPVIKWDGVQFNLPLATGLAAYANMLPLLMLQFAKKVAHQGGIAKVVFLLDNLPGNPALSMRFMKALAFAHPRLKGLWHEIDETGIQVQVANLKNYVSPKGKNRPGNLNPCAILVDWLIAACVARENPDQIARESGLSNDAVGEIAAVWTAAGSRCAVSIGHADDPGGPQDLGGANSCTSDAR